MKKKKMLGLFLTIVMVLGSTGIVSAGSGYESITLSNFHEYNVYYDAYCGSTYGDASTTIYVDDTADWSYAYVSATLYIIDSYYADTITDEDILEQLAVEAISNFDGNRAAGNDRVDASVMLSGINTTKYECFKIVSEHEAEVGNMVTTYSDSYTMSVRY